MSLAVISTHTKAWVNVGPKDIWQPIMVAQAPGQRCNPCMIEHDMVGPRLKHSFQIQWHPKQKQSKTQENTTKQHRKNIKKNTENKHNKKHTKNFACLIQSVVAHRFYFGIVYMVHFDLNSTIPCYDLIQNVVVHVFLRIAGSF